MSRKFHQRKRFWFLLGAGAMTAAAWIFHPEISAMIARFDWHAVHDAVQAAGPWGPVLCIVLNAVFTLLSLPTTLVCILVALLYGVGWGLPICLAGLSLGMGTAFLIARYVARGWLERRIGHTRLFRRLEESMRRDGWKIVFFSRLLPINPYSILNYAYGLTNLPFWRYLLVSTMGVIPNVLALLWTAKAAGKLARGQTDWKVLLILFSGAGLFAVLAWLPRLLRRRMPEIIPDPDDAEDAVETPES